MKGIKECVNWLLDNPGCKLRSLDRPEVDEPNSGLIYREVGFVEDEEGHKLITWIRGVGEQVCLTVFEDEEWEEVIEPVDFLTAYKDCLENGTKYNGECVAYRDQIMRNSNGIVVVKDIGVSDIVELNGCRWIKEV